MELKSKTVISLNGKPKYKIFYNDEWMSFYDLAETAKAITNNLSPQILQWRWNRGYRTVEKLLGPKSKRGRNKIDIGHAQEGGLFSNCDPALANACMHGTNKDLLELSIDREPYITPGEKRRAGLL